MRTKSTFRISATAGLFAVGMFLIQIEPGVSSESSVYFLRNDTDCPTDDYYLYRTGCTSPPERISDRGRLGPHSSATVIVPACDFGFGPTPGLLVQFLSGTYSNVSYDMPASGPTGATYELPTDCNSITNDAPDEPPDCTEGCQSCGSGFGMAVWRISEAPMNLWITDEPTGYQPAAGPRVALRLAFRQREVLIGTDANIFSVGKRWNFSWFSYVTKDTNGTNVVLFPEGGLHSFPNSQDYLSNTRLSGETNTSFTLSYPDGQKNVYGFIVTNGSGIFDKAFLTEHWNANSQKTTFYYASYNPANPVVRLLYVVDGDGRTNTVSYVSSNPYSTNLISQVADPFGRTAYMAYDNSGLLTNITDVESINSGITYSNNWPSSLTTPYGTTSFTITDTSGTNVIPNGRSILITQPDGGHQLYFYKDSAPGVPAKYPSSEVPDTTPFANTIENTGMAYRNTFYWGPKQYAALSTTDIASFTTNDFRKARMRHWL